MENTNWQSYFKRIFFNKLHFLKIQELEVPIEAVKEFEEIYEKGISIGEGAFIAYQSRYPKYLFLNYLIEHKNILVHGSNDINIHSLEPRNQSLFNGKPAKAVFAASDGVWSLFFAVLNRKNYAGSLRNLCLTIPTKKGIRRYYYFSLNREFKGECWTEGAIYFLPKDSFRQGGIKDEWVSESTVMPLAKLAVTPKDFPFTQKIRRHSESDSIIKSVSKALLFNK